MSTSEGDFERLTDQFGEEDRINAALDITRDLTSGYETGVVQELDVTEIVAKVAVEDLFGECDFPRYCKFYGEEPDFCDRICGESVWDQI